MSPGLEAHDTHWDYGFWDCLARPGGGRGTASAYIEPTRIHFQVLKHFAAHAALGVLLALIFLLNR
jgi:hypothetical protein